MTSTEPSHRLVIGRISGIYGVKGWLKIFSHTEPRENILTYPKWWLTAADGTVREWVVETGAVQGKGVVAKLRGCNDRDQAALLMQQEIAISTADLAPLAAGEYYWHQLLGLTMVTVKGVVLGTITDLMETGANDVLQIRTDSGEEHLVPYLPESVVVKVDLAARQMVVEWDLDY